MAIMIIIGVFAILAAGGVALTERVDRPLRRKAREARAAEIA